MQLQPSAIKIEKIALVQFKNYTQAAFHFGSNITCITGANGSGKTNLLDAVYYMCYTKSYFSASQQSNIKQGFEGFRVSGVFKKNESEYKVSCKWKGGKKEIVNNDAVLEKPTDHIGSFAAVMIAPDDIELINGGSEERRRWVDSILSQTDKQYLEYLLLYQKVLQQRNAWLKLYAVQNNGDFTALEYYDMQLVKAAAFMHAARLDFMKAFMPFLTEYYSALCAAVELPFIGYASDLDRGNYQDLLKSSLEHDIRYQRTLKGLHKDDWEFLLDGKSLKQMGSQGQKKTFLFALKLGQYAYLSYKMQAKPILLLDDVFEKLDQNRMAALLRIIQTPDFGQVLLTDTHVDRVVNTFNNTTTVEVIQL